MVGLSESSRTLIKDIGVGKQQLVEIAKALAKHAKLLILDEPTSSLNETDSRALLDLLLEFKKQGMTSIIISHKLNEVSYVADKITVIRDGSTIETLDKDLMQNKRYDMGFVQNFKQVFGENKLLWFLPINLASGYPNGDGLTWPTKEEVISLDNLNINEINSQNDNNDNVVENNIEKNATKNYSFTGRTGQTRASSLNDYPVSNRGLFGNFTKYNSVKRNSGNYNSNSTGYDTNSSKSKNGYNKNNDIISK
jgi:ABC-type sugar transport system ATPase subunit